LADFIAMYETSDRPVIGPEQIQMKLIKRGVSWDSESMDNFASLAALLV
jgi:hypothetical protein